MVHPMVTGRLKPSWRPRELVGLDPAVLIAVHPCEEPVHLALQLWLS